MNIQLDDDGDWLVTNNQLQTVTGADEIAQKIKNRLRAFRGEWFLDVRVGMPWFEKILKKNPNPAEVETIITEEIVNTDGVLNVRDIELSLDNLTRKLRVDFSAEVIDGVINFSEVLP